MARVVFVADPAHTDGMGPVPEDAEVTFGN